MLKSYIKAGIDYEEKKEKNKANESGNFRVAIATIGFFANAQTRAEAPQIRQKTTDELKRIEEIANSRTVGSSIWINNQLELMEELHQTVRQYENSDSSSMQCS